MRRSWGLANNAGVKHRETIARVTTWALIIGAGCVFVPFWSAVLLAVWVGLAVRPLTLWVARTLRIGQHFASGLAVLLVALVMAPVVAIVASVAMDAVDFVTAAVENQRIRDVLQQLASSGPTVNVEPRSLFENPLQLLATHGGRALEAAQYVAGAATWATLNVLVFLVSLYAVLTDGPRAWYWLVNHGPLPPEHTRRYGMAFIETGKGLFLGIGGAGLIQSILATTMYLGLGVTRPLAMGFLTLIASFVPAIGTAFVWGPVSAGLALAGRYQAALLMGAFGMLVIGTVDNILKPVIARRAALSLPTYVVLISMLGGLMAFGPAGLFAGPLIVRLAHESMRLRSEAIAAAVATSEPPADA